MQIRTLQMRMEYTEQELLQQIEKYMKKHNKAPTMRELSRLCTSVSSTSTIKAYLDRLKEKGILHYEPRTPRSITIKKELPTAK
ncbi:LexA family protein [Bacillus timonensis]|uniref:LexA family protein n=1 Tax=Bacillus timonensis TaxID=1033734 RepID=UPI000288E206|nr:LexA family transcriptional regulator [Bacillus timonensis]